MAARARIQEIAADRMQRVRQAGIALRQLAQALPILLEDAFDDVEL